MNIEFSVKDLRSFIRDVKSEASAASENRPLPLFQKEDTVRVYFCSQEEVDEAYTSAWIHRYHPFAFRKFPGFDASGIDPLSFVGEDNIARRAGGQMDKLLGTPWGRSRDGADVCGTIGIAEDDGRVESVLLAIGMQQPMAQLAFLVSWTTDSLGAIAPAIQTDPPAVSLLAQREVKKGKKTRVLNFTFPAFLQADSLPIINRALEAIENGADLIFLSPGNAESHHYFATTKTRFEVAEMIRLGSVAQIFPSNISASHREGSKFVVPPYRNGKILEKFSVKPETIMYSASFGQKSRSKVDEMVA